MDKAITKVTELLSEKKEKRRSIGMSSSAFRKLLGDIQKKHGNFCLNDLLISPFQRITKYHLFFQNLHSQSDVNPDYKVCLKVTWESMNEVCKYLNQCKKDQDCMSKISALSDSLNSSKTGLNFMGLGRFLKDECISKIKAPHLANKEINGKKVLFLFEKALLITSKLYCSIDTIPIEQFEIHTEQKSLLPGSKDHFIMLTNVALNKTYELHFKNLEQKNHWIELFKLVKPANLEHGKHKFSLTNFEKNIVECVWCHKFNLVYRAVEEYTGDPAPPNKEPVLKFDKNEIIYLDETASGSWLHGYKLKFNQGNKLKESLYNNDGWREYGYFPKSFIAKANPHTDLNIYSWFLNGDKNLAKKILMRIPSNQAIFLVRSSSELNSYTVTMKYNEKIVRILIQSIENASRVYFSIDRKRFFSSIPELINFFSKTCLANDFKGLDTNLGVAFREALPEPICIVTAKYDYEPAESLMKNELSDFNFSLKNLKSYFFLNYFDEWCHLFDSTGLIGYAPKTYLNI